MTFNSDLGSSEHESKRLDLDLLLLHQNQKTRDRIEEAVARQNWRYRVLTDLPALRDALDGGAKAILVDTSYLPELPRHLLRLTRRRQQRPGLFFVSDRCDIQTRLQAMRAGASRLFAEPLDLDALVAALEAHISPKAKPWHKVLIVADDESQATLAADLLRKGELETYAISDPLDIIDAIWRIQPDLIFMLDLDIHGVDGIALTKLIRERKEAMAIPIIFLSGEDDPEKIMLTLQAGADDFLCLPIQLQLLLTTVRGRIERSKTISSAGPCRDGEQSFTLPTRRALLLRLRQVLQTRGVEKTSYGLIVVSLEDSGAGIKPWRDGEREQPLEMLSKGLYPLLQAEDYLARTGDACLGVLVSRPRQEDVEQLAGLAYEITSNRLAASVVPEGRLGVGLVLLDATEEARANALLRLGEATANYALQQGIRGHLLNGWAPTATPSYSIAETKADYTTFLDTLQKGSLSLQERRFVKQSEARQPAAVLELIPRSSDLSAAEDLYQLASRSGTAAEFSRQVCNLGILLLGEYKLQWQPVKLILQQSAVVLEESDYVEFIKSVLRRQQIVGTGLMLEFKLSSLASNLKRACHLFRELDALGIAICLSHFTDSKSAYKALSYLKASAIRPRPALLQADAENIDTITRQIHAAQTEIILPHVKYQDRIAPRWYQAADYLQEEFTA